MSPTIAVVAFVGVLVLAVGIVLIWTGWNDR